MEEVPQDLVYPILDLDKWQPRHQTLTVFQVCEDATYSWQERSLRMASGFNTAETIKVDIMSLSDGDFYEGLVFTGKHPGGLPYEAIRDQAGGGTIKCFFTPIPERINERSRARASSSVTGSARQSGPGNLHLRV